MTTESEVKVGMARVHCIILNTKFQEDYLNLWEIILVLLTSKVKSHGM